MDGAASLPQHQQLPGWGEPAFPAPRARRAKDASPAAVGAAVAVTRPHSPAADADGWTVVSKPRPRRPSSLARPSLRLSPATLGEAAPEQPSVVQGCCPHSSSWAPQSDDVSVLAELDQDGAAAPAQAPARAVASLLRAQTEVEADGFVRTLASGVRAALRTPVRRLVLLGLGSPTSSAPARYQLALALLLAEALHVKAVFAYDPAFDDEDAALLAHRGCRVLTAAAASLVHAVPDAQSTLFFMPHCERFLYEQVLTANARRSALTRLAIVGNSFAEYAARVELTSGDQHGSSWLTRLQPYVTELPVAAGPAFPVSAFNSMALHTLTDASVDRIAALFPEVQD